MDIRTWLDEGRYLIFDGGMGTMLQAAGLQPGTLPEEWNLTHPENILAVHKAYVEAGSDIVSTNTFGANSRKYGAPVDEVIRSALRIAHHSGARFVAQDIGPTGLMLKPIGDADFEEAYELYREQVLAGVSAGEDAPDVFIIETMTDLLEMKAAVLAVRENSDLPVFASMSYEKSGRTFLGVSAAAATVTLCGLGVDAVGVNCSLGPDELGDIVEEICRYSSVPVILQANAGLPSSIDGKTVFNVEPADYCKAVSHILDRTERFSLSSGEAGHPGRNMSGTVGIIGGCCGTNPEYISGLRRMLQERNIAVDHISGGKPDVLSDCPVFHALVCSPTMIVDYDNRTAVVGERLNPTGKKKISAALREQNYDLLVAEGLQEYECGAQILDVNAGLPDIDESETLKRLIYELQGACPLPLQIDTTDAKALETAVRHYNGKPIINSVNGKEESMNTVLPIAAKYGAAVICLTLDENGIPERAEDRIAIAERIMRRADELGIPRQNLIVDGLTMTVSTNQNEARETLKTVGMVRSKLGLHTCLGVSNISFGLPNREVLNATFLAEAFTCGLNLPIIDPTRDRYMQTVYAHRVLNGEDINSEKYIEYAVAHPIDSKKQIGLIGALAASSEPAAVNESVKGRISEIIASGNKAAITEATESLLNEMSAMDIINNEFIPALDYVGELYEKGKIFLPQLMSAAETAKRGFDLIRMSSHGETDGASSGRNRLKIVLATVQGDIHDIGKNIVRMLLENYGYEVNDLGKDVPAEKIIAAVKADKVGLVGLSALMTTTVHSMEETIKALRKECPECRIVVGGAVLTEELAKKIGADFYAKDAAETARIASLTEKQFKS